MKIALIGLLGLVTMSAAHAAKIECKTSLSWSPTYLLDHSYVGKDGETSLPPVSLDSEYKKEDAPKGYPLPPKGFSFSAEYVPFPPGSTEIPELLVTIYRVGSIYNVQAAGTGSAKATLDASGTIWTIACSINP